MRHTQSCYFAANSSSIPRNMSKKPRTKIKHKLHDKWHTSSNQEQRTREGDRAKEGKKGERAGEKMEISKLLVSALIQWHFRFSDEVLCATIVVVLHRYFPLFASLFSSTIFVCNPLQLNCKQVAHQRDLRRWWCCFLLGFFLFRVGTEFLIFACPLPSSLSLHYSKSPHNFCCRSNFTTSFFGCSVSSSKLESVQLFHGERFVARFYFGWLVWQKCVESVIDALMGKNSGESHWIIVIRSPELHQIHNNNNNNNRKWM